jgi:hypothetical protein
MRNILAFIRKAHFYLDPLLAFATIFALLGVQIYQLVIYPSKVNILQLFFVLCVIWIAYMLILDSNDEFLS